MNNNNANSNINSLNNVENVPPFEILHSMSKNQFSNMINDFNINSMTSSSNYLLGVNETNNKSELDKNDKLVFSFDSKFNISKLNQNNVLFTNYLAFKVRRDH